MMYIFRHIFIALVLLINITLVDAQEAEIRSFSFFSQKKGLSNYNIHKILQDNKKFLWIATQDGLNRFDGNEFLIFNKGLEPKRALWSNDIRDLIYDSLQQVLWVICNQGGINAIDLRTASIKYSIPYNYGNLATDWRICAAYCKERIYIGTSGGLEVFDIRSRMFVNSSVNPASVMDEKHIRTLAIDKYGNLWCGVLGKGIVIYQPDENRILKFISADKLNIGNNVFFWPVCTLFSKDNICWVATRSGLLKIRYNKEYDVLPERLKQPLLLQVANQQINHLSFDKNDNLIISANHLLRYVEASGKLIKISPSDRESERWLTDITYCYEDYAKNLWLGCKQGLGLMKNQPLAFYPVRNGEYFKNQLSHLYALCALNKSKLLAGTKEGLFLIKNEKEITPLIEGSLVQNIFRFKGGDVLISGNRGICLYSDGKILSIEKKYPEFEKYKKWQLNSSSYINDSVIVLGTESNDGILLWNTNEHKILNIRKSAAKRQPGLVANIVNTIFVTRSRQAVVLSDAGCSILNTQNGTIKQLIFKEGNSQQPVGIFMDMEETKKNYWLTVYGEGLMKLDKNFRLLKIFGLKEGISNTGVYKIFNYKDSFLVVTSNYGVSVFNTASETFEKYFEEDGLHNNTFEEACGDAFDGMFYAGGVDGFTKVDPTKFMGSPYLPNLYFTMLKLQLPDNNLKDTSNLEMQYFKIPDIALQTNIYFSGLYFQNAGRVNYAYRLSNSNNDWVNLGNQNFLTLTGLNPGIYNLEVKAANEAGMWGSVKRLKLEVMPKWYQTYWFYLLVALLVAAVLYGFYLYRVSQIQQQHLLRKNIASDLHDDFGSTLNTIKMLTHIAEKNPGKDYFRQIEHLLTEATQSLRDMIWVLDDSKDTVEELVSRINKFAIHAAEAQNISFVCKLNADVKTLILSKTEKRNLYLITKEAVNNCVKYAACTSVTFSLAENSNKKKVFTIADNGKGFDSNNSTEGNGLKNMSFRAGQIQYSFMLNTTPGQGTVIRVEKK